MEMVRDGNVTTRLGLGLANVVIATYSPRNISTSDSRR
jgi:hypothetical protein